jgi:hypothetical protein
MLVSGNVVIVRLLLLVVLIPYLPQPLLLSVLPSVVLEKLLRSKLILELFCFDDARINQNVEISS